VTDSTLGNRLFGGKTLLQRIFRKYKKESEQCDKLAVALEDIMKVIEADDLIAPSVSYMQEAQKTLILYKAHKALRLEKAWKAVRALMSETGASHE
jgi:hypothetical protein